MDNIRGYLLSLIVTCLLCTLLPELLPEGTSRTLLRFLCNLVLAVRLLSPLGNIPPELPRELPLFQEEAVSAAADGEKLARDALMTVIKEEAESYIMDKAAELGARIRPELELSQDPPHLPESVIIRGTISPEAKASLKRLLSSQFGIPEEAQLWTP